jgi:hypothetical protein
MVQAVKRQYYAQHYYHIIFFSLTLTDWYVTICFSTQLPEYLHPFLFLWLFHFSTREFHLKFELIASSFHLHPCLIPDTHGSVRPGSFTDSTDFKSSNKMLKSNNWLTGVEDCINRSLTSSCIWNSFFESNLKYTVVAIKTLLYHHGQLLRILYTSSPLASVYNPSSTSINHHHYTSFSSICQRR